MAIQWYPGHMAKAVRELAESLKLIDVVAEIVDARAPRATRNPDFDRLFRGKKRVVILNKSDLADPAQTRAWIDAYRRMGFDAMDFVAVSAARRKALIELIGGAAREKVEKSLEKGVRKTVRAMAAGVPNVGKSAVINRIAGGVPARAEDRPGVTKGMQWVKITPYLELLDTPGLLWPRMDDPVLARHAACVGSVRDEVVDLEELGAGLLSELMELCPGPLMARYKKLERGMGPEEMLEGVCAGRGFILSGGVFDTERAARTVLDEYRAGKIARVTLDRAEE